MLDFVDGQVVQTDLRLIIHLVFLFCSAWHFICSRLQILGFLVIFSSLSRVVTICSQYTLFLLLCCLVCILLLFGLSLLPLVLTYFFFFLFGLVACIFCCYGLVEEFVDYPGRTREIESFDFGFRGSEIDVVVQYVSNGVVSGLEACDGFWTRVLGVVSLLLAC